MTQQRITILVGILLAHIAKWYYTPRWKILFYLLPLPRIASIVLAFCLLLFHFSCFHFLIFIWGGGGARYILCTSMYYKILYLELKLLADSDIMSTCWRCLLRTRTFSLKPGRPPSYCRSTCWMSVPVYRTGRKLQVSTGNYVNQSPLTAQHGGHLE
jgi:hypothetical protein